MCFTIGEDSSIGSTVWTPEGRRELRRPWTEHVDKMEGFLMSVTISIRARVALALLGWAALFTAGPVRAAIPQEGAMCPSTPPWSMELPLDYPPSITPGPDGAINTSYIVRKRDLCVPLWTATLCKGTYTVCTKDQDCGATAPAGSCATNASKSWGWQVQNLRAYGSPKNPSQSVDPKNPNDPNLRWGYPGPTLRARTEKLKNPALPPNPTTNPQVTPGTRIKVALYNYLDKTTYSDSKECNPASYRACTDSATTMCTSDSDCTAPATCGTPTPVPQHHPECFHGDDVTNLHYHGTHVSPLPHQDYVLLNLFPYGSTGVPTDKEDYAVGMYQTDINPLPWNQAPGTHWYHPHKHGSTSLQVLNGLSGSLIITGAFDDWLNGIYGSKLVDRVLVVQQVTDDLNFFNAGVPNYPPKMLVNGFATPKITMRPGEIQRWRFIGATMQASASLEIGFDPRIKETFQIAQDGVQFAWQNYARQPYRDTEGTYSNFKLSPGNRADFLIRAPTVAGTYSVDSRVVTQGLGANVLKLFKPEASVALRVPPIQQTEGGGPPVDGSGDPLLFTIEVVGAPLAPEMQFPATPPITPPITNGPPVDPACATQPKANCWPVTPSYLEDLPEASKPPRQIAFSIDGNNAVQPNSFWINNTQYNGSCAGATMVRGSTEDWQVANKLGRDGNTRMLPHPFHIHINPFQVHQNADRKFEPPYIWQDVIALPTTSATDRPAGPIWSNEDAQVKCPRACQADNATWNGQWTTTIQGQLSVCGCIQNETSVLIRHRFDDYTGAYVIHCHFLGHEDRGMMWNVQTVCNPSEPKSIFGTTQTNGGADACPGGSPRNALPECKEGEVPHH